MIHSFAVIFVLTFIFLIGLTAAPAYVKSEAVQGQHLCGDPLMLPPAMNPADQPLMINHPLASPLLAQAWYPVLDEDPLGEEDQLSEKKTAIEPITRTLPIWGQKARARGFDLPLPFGGGANLVFMDQGESNSEMSKSVSAIQPSKSKVLLSATPGRMIERARPG